jgi:hypothetical protein
VDIHPSLAGVGCLGWVQGRCQAPSNWAVLQLGCAVLGVGGSSK